MCRDTPAENCWLIPRDSIFLNLTICLVLFYWPLSSTRLYFHTEQAYLQTIGSRSVKRPILQTIRFFLKHALLGFCNIMSWFSSSLWLFLSSCRLIFYLAINCHTSRLSSWPSNLTILSLYRAQMARCRNGSLTTMEPQ